MTKRYLQKGKKRNRTRKKLKIVSVNPNNISRINKTYNHSKIYNDTKSKYTAVDQSKVNTIIDTKINNLLKIFDDERLQNIRPQTDFHKVTNLTWINKMDGTKNNEYYTQFDNYRVTQDKVYYNLIQLVKEYIKTDRSKTSRCVQNMFQSWSQLNSVSIEKHIHQCVDRLHAIAKDPSVSVWTFLGRLNENEIISHSLPFKWFIAEDKKNNTQFANYIISSKLGLYDLDIYFNSEKETKKDKQKYLHFIETVFEICLGKKHGLSAQDVFDVEYTMLMSFGCDVKNNNDNGYNKVFAKDALSKYEFDWNQMARALGYKHTPSFFIANNLNYLKCMSTELTANWNTPKWMNYWIFIHLVQMIRFHPKWRYIYYNYYEKELFGQNAIFPDEIYPIFGLTVSFNRLLTTLYQKHNIRQEYIDYATRMSNNMREIFIQRLQNNKWLGKETKKYAENKIRHIHIQIDSSIEDLMDDPLLNYDKKDAWGNMMLLFQWRRIRFVSLNEKKIVEFPHVDWKTFQMVGTQTYIVNAFYIPSFNRIFIPLAYLQKPFIDLDDRGLEYNLANIGFVLAHELSHSLDIIGSKYDHVGNLYDWWTSADKKRYKALMDDVNKQYRAFMAKDKIYPEITFYLGENIADITGLALCTDYLILYHSVKNTLESVSTTFLSLKMLYNFYSIQMRQHISNQSMQLLLKTNPHPPDKYRVNCPLARSLLFHKIFAISNKDDMYWNYKIKMW